MKIIGIKKEIDSLGRVVIPKDIRRLFNFEKEVELIVTEDGVLIKNPEYKLIKTKAANSGEPAADNYFNFRGVSIRPARETNVT